MARPAPDPDAIAFARDRHAAGLSPEAIAAEMARIDHQVSARQVRRWLAAPAASVAPQRAKANAQRPGAALAARRSQSPTAAPPAAPEEETDDVVFDTLTALKGMLRRTLRDAETQRVINPKLAQQLGRDAGALANTIARYERGQADDADTLTFSRKEIDDGMAALLEKMAGGVERCKAAGGLTCAKCGRELSVDLGSAPAAP